MKTKLSPFWIAIVVILWIIAIGALLENQVVGCVFFLGTSFLVAFCKANTDEPESTETKKPFSKSSAMNELA